MKFSTTFGVLPLLMSVVNGLVLPPALKPLTARVIVSPTPIVYVYDHCPFCVRVRLAFGFKNIKHEVRFLANDDVETPTKLIGKKAVPIFQMGPSGKGMPESLDIIQAVDADPAFGPTGFFKPFSTRVDLKEWQSRVKDSNSACQRPRYMMVPLPEFNQLDAREAFVRNHPLPSFEKATWKENLTSQQRWSEYVKSYEQSLTMIDGLNEALKDLDKLIYSENHCSEGGLGLDDIDLWSRLRSMTLTKGLVWPEKLGKYMNNLAQQGDMPLYFTMQV